MSRTVLFDLLRRACAISTLAVKTDIPSAEVYGLLSEPVSRRQLLSGFALMGGLGLRREMGDRPSVTHHRLAQTPFSQSNIRQATDSTVLVVGAGVAGLTAAYRLRQAGVPVDLVEASQRIGGRVLSLTDVPNAPGTVELGGEFIDTRHTAVLSLAAELGLSVADLKVADAGLIPETLYFQGNTISHTQVIAAFAPLAKRIAADLQQLRDGEQSLSYHNHNPHAIALDRLSLAEYLAQTPVDPIIESLVRVAYVTEYGLDAEEQSCLNLLFLIGTETGEWSTYGISDERYHVVGGNEQIPRRLAAHLEGAIETSTVLESIRFSPGGNYRVSLQADSTSIERSYDRILLTVPFGVLRQVEFAVDLPPIKRTVINTLGYGNSTKLVMPYQERIWRSRYGSTASIYTDRDFQNTWESARYQTGHGGWLTNLRGGTEGLALGVGDPERHAQALALSLEPLLPGIGQVQRGRSLRAFWAANPHAKGSYSCYRPGQWTQLAGAEAERVGNLWFAGEHCSTASQGYINGACETAEAAVLSILKDIGLEADTLHPDRGVAGGAARYPTTVASSTLESNVAPF
ncbi:FAD-dependent oxidoreductase [Oculatella sp. LEGE 06141]|uniref:flavin monoamine oxidase family protein n=1 Tax=Oculatella sp. LEGE 06141 TaxID=1828648 RepID=UPI0018814D36|nr:NAD(P)/FAD-dependent oxidoreductase [Oculatella sp. LEGE 06141]MBE9177855.1 FAD-dependent oxidoreductase [Oculatella sp. LEGE 06141]